MGFSAFLISITDADVRADSRSCGLNNKHVVYMLRVMNGDKQWICEKRYSDFMMLDDVLRSKFWYTAVPKLPSKKYFFNFDDEFIKKRKKELETYLKEVLQVACFSQSDELWQFFTDSRSIVGVPPELEEENARHAQVLPTDNEP